MRAQGKGKGVQARKPHAHPRPTQFLSDWLLGRAELSPTLLGLYRQDRSETRRAVRCEQRPELARQLPQIRSVVCEVEVFTAVNLDQAKHQPQGIGAVRTAVSTQHCNFDYCVGSLHESSLHSSQKLTFDSLCKMAKF